MTNTCSCLLRGLYTRPSMPCVPFSTLLMVSGDWCGVTERVHTLPTCLPARRVLKGILGLFVGVATIPAVACGRGGHAVKGRNLWWGVVIRMHHHGCVTHQHQHRRRVLRGLAVRRGTLQPGSTAAICGQFLRFSSYVLMP